MRGETCRLLISLGALVLGLYYAEYDDFLVVVNFGTLLGAQPVAVPLGTSAGPSLLHDGALAFLAAPVRDRLHFGRVGLYYYFGLYSLVVSFVHEAVLAGELSRTVAFIQGSIGTAFLCKHQRPESLLMQARMLWCRRSTCLEALYRSLQPPVVTSLCEGVCRPSSWCWCWWRPWSRYHRGWRHRRSVCWRCRGAELDKLERHVRLPVSIVVQHVKGAVIMARTDRT